MSAPSGTDAPNGPNVSGGPSAPGAPSARRTPRRRPPWWPQDEEWPPGEWRGYGPWGRRSHRGGPPMLFRLGCALVVLAILGSIAVNIIVWVVATVLGQSSAPPAGIVILIGILLGTLIAGSATARGVRRMSAPLEDMANAAERIERGDYSVRVAESGPARLRSLARAFNDMSTRLGAIDERRRAFLADAAHEMRTPLSIISGQLEAIEEGLYPADAEHLAPVHEQIGILEHLIDDMRTVALAEAGALPLDLRPTDVGTAIDHAVAAFQPEATAKRITLAADYQPGLPSAMADEQRLGQVLSNLLSNALRYTPSGGHVSVSARTTSATAASASGPAAVTGPPLVELAVRDDGPGIPADLLPRVFDRFVKEPGSSGSGLGLAICRDLVEAQGGHISIDSAPGRGTIVTFTLPLA